MSLDGLRAWISEVERKLAKRTRVMLALVGVAIAIAAASVFLAIDARSGSVSEGDVQALQEKLEQRIDEVEEEAEPTAGVGLAPDVGGGGALGEESLGDPEGRGESGSDGAEGQGSGSSGSGSGAGAGGASSGGASSGGDDLQRLLEQAGAAGN